MRFSEIFAVDRVTTRLCTRGKEDTLRALARLFVASDHRLDEDTVFRTFCDRERMASTGVGFGIAIPHARLSCLNELEAVVAISPEGVSFDAADGQPTRIFIAVLAPPRHTGSQLKVLARISRLLRDEAVRGRLLEAESRERVLSIMLEASIVLEEERRPLHRADAVAVYAS